MAKGPEFRMIGGASPEKKEQAREKMEQALFQHYESLSPREKEEMAKFEYPKSEKEVALINFANRETDALMQEAGIEPYDVPAENYHLVASELYEEMAGENSGTATTLVTKQGIIFDAQYFRDNPVFLAAVALHETLHLKGHFSMEVEEEGDKAQKTPYRNGMSVRAVQKHGLHGKYHEHFEGLHEAIVSEVEKRALPQILDLPELAKEKEWLLSDEAKELRKKLAERKKIPEDDIVWVGKKGKNDWETVSYPQQRGVLQYVCTEIQEQCPDRYQSADAVFKEFLRAHFTGQLLQIARPVEETFGEGSFRLLGNMATEEQDAVLHLESLKKARARVLKSAE